MSNLEPVTRHGHPTNGYTAVDAPDDASVVDCTTGGPQPSRSAVSVSVYDCGPTANLSDACFPGDQPHTVLCLTNPWRKVLTRFRLGHPNLDSGGVVPDRHALPHVTPPKHPTWFGYYSCNRHKAIWGPGNNQRGINRKHKAWTVWAGPANGTLHKYAVRHAYYVAVAK